MKAWINRNTWEPTSLDRVGYRTIIFAYLLFTMGTILAGSLWKHEAIDATRPWEPTRSGAAIIWLFYTIFLYTRRRPGWKGRKARRVGKRSGIRTPSAHDRRKPHSRWWAVFMIRKTE